MPGPASPNLTLTVTPPGGSPANLTSYLAWSGANQVPTITQNFGRQGDTATFILIDEYTSSIHFSVPALSQIKLVDNTIGITLFAGVVSTPTLTVTSPNRNEWLLQCTDYTFYADNAIVHGIFNGLTADQVMIALTKQANCGISAVPIAQGGFIAPAPVLSQVVINYMTLSAAWRTLAQLSSSVTPYGWYVDEQLRLHFFDSSTALNSGVTFTTTPTGISSTEGHFAVDTQFAYEWDGATIRNRIIVQGATQTFYANLKGNPTDTWRADGVTLSYPLRYTVTGTPALSLNNVTTNITVITGGGSVPSGTTWSIQQNAIGQWFLITTSAPAAGTIIRLWYSYQVPVVAAANDVASQVAYAGPNGGVYVEYINDTSLTTAPMALARAQRERTEYAFAVERASFNTSDDFTGWVRAGQTFGYVNQFIPDTRNSYIPGLNGTFLMVSGLVTFGRGGYRTINVTGVRL